MSASYFYYCCGEWYDSDPEYEYLAQPCPKCGVRSSPAKVTGIPATGREFTPYKDPETGVRVLNRREERAIHDEQKIVRLNKRQWEVQVKEPTLHECWKQEHGLPAFETPIAMPSVEQVKDGLEKARARLAVDDNYRRQFDPTHPGFARGPEGGTT